MEKLLNTINETAINYQKTGDEKYKKLWYKLVKEFADGSYIAKRRVVSISECHKRDDGTYLVIGKSRLL
tara:strand:- start:287 stop:493 length:207 start_codon:yes stop_codon:yes gene_type:complete